MEAIKEWQDPKRKPFLSRALKCRFPFVEDGPSVRKIPRLDAAFYKVSRHTGLTLDRAMDKRMDSLLKVTWNYTLGRT